MVESIIEYHGNWQRQLINQCSTCDISINISTKPAIRCNHWKTNLQSSSYLQLSSGCDPPTPVGWWWVGGLYYPLYIHTYIYIYTLYSISIYIYIYGLHLIIQRGNPVLQALRWQASCSSVGIWIPIRSLALAVEWMDRSNQWAVAVAPRFRLEAFER